MNWWLSCRVSALQSVVAGSISSGGDYAIHCWWDLIRSKQLSSVPICCAQVFGGFSGNGDSIHNPQLIKHKSHENKRANSPDLRLNNEPQCRGIKANRIELLLLMTQLQPTIVCLQETFLKTNDVITIENHQSYNYTHNTGHRALAGVLILIRYDIQGAYNKFPDFFRMGTFIDSTHMKLSSPSK